MIISYIISRNEKPMKRLLLFTIFAFISAFSCLAIPKTIIIFRHAEGYFVEKKTAEIGPCLSRDGYYRSFSFLKYYLDVIVNKKDLPFPDYIFASNPYDKNSKHNMAHSARHIETVAPLVTWMYEHRPDTTKKDLLLIPYRKMEYKKLAKLLIEADYLNDKTILICWSHSVIHKMINNISEFSGYRLEPNIDYKKWKGDDFGSVVILSIDKENKVITCKETSNAFNLPANEEEKQALLKWFFS